MTVESRTIGISFHEDTEVDASVLVFDDQARGRDLVTLPVNGPRGDVVATVTFGPTGKLVQMELLRASVQVPDSLR